MWHACNRRGLNWENAMKIRKASVDKWKALLFSPSFPFSLKLTKFVMKVAEAEGPFRSVGLCTHFLRILVADIWQITSKFGTFVFRSLQIESLIMYYTRIVQPSYPGTRPLLPFCLLATSIIVSILWNTILIKYEPQAQKHTLLNTYHLSMKQQYQSMLNTKKHPKQLFILFYGKRY